MMRKILYLGLIILCLCGCSKTKENTNTEDKLENIIAKNNYIIVDVRTKEEYDESHVKNAINIPYDEINEETSLDKTKTIIVYCKSGRRSGIAKSTLENLGYTVLDLGAFDSITLEKE